MTNFTIVGDSNNRDFWLKQRSLGIGSSEVWRLWDEPYALWALKSGLVPEEDLSGDERVQWGKRLERPILAAFTEESKIAAEFSTMLLRSTQWPWMSCTPDGFTTDEIAAPCECKNVALEFHKEWADEAVPPKFIFQVQTQIAVTGAEFGYIAALIGGNHLIYRKLLRDDKLISEIVERGSQMAQRIATGSAPPMDASESSSDAVGQVFPKDDGTTVQLDEETSQVALRLIAAKRDEKATKKIIKGLENKLKAEMGAHTTGLIMRGGWVTWKQQTRKATVQKESTFRVLRLKSDGTPSDVDDDEVI